MPETAILLGVIGRPHGVRGLVHVTSYTADPNDLTAYGPLSDTKGRSFLLTWRAAGVAEVSEMVAGQPIKLADREAAARLTNTRLFIERDRLPSADDDEFYLADLVGIVAVDTDGATVGRVAVVHDYGAGTSLEIERAEGDSLLVPFTHASVPEVDVRAGRLVVNPPEEVVVRECAEATSREAAE
jgi:16S rRNA processing protein RimM